MAKKNINQEQDESQVLKRCTKCQVEKLASEFLKAGKTKDGLTYRCKNCIKQYYQDNKEKLAAKQKQYRQANKEKVAIRQRKYRQANIEKAVLYNKQYQQDNSKAISLRKKKYNRTKQGKNVNSKHYYKRRALELRLDYEDFNPNEILERDGYICQLCGRKTRPDYKNSYHPLYPNLDHIVPLSKGGAHTRLNTQCLCRQCNMEKGSTGAGDQLRMFG